MSVVLYWHHEVYFCNECACVFTKVKAQFFELSTIWDIQKARLGLASGDLSDLLKEISTSAHLSCQLCPSYTELFAESVEKGDTSAAGRALLTHTVKLFWDNYCKTASLCRWRHSIFTSNNPTLSLPQTACIRCTVCMHTHRVVDGVKGIGHNGIVFRLKQVRRHADQDCKHVRQEVKDGRGGREHTLLVDWPHSSPL